MKKRFLAKLWNLWPPFLGANIRITSVSPDFRSVEVRLKQHFLNTNPMGSNFGGSIYAMTDPFYAMILIKNLGPDYIVWDKSASINFKKPGLGALTAKFNMTVEQIEAIKNEADTNRKAEPHFKVEVRDESGAVVAEVDKVVYVRRREHTPPQL